MRIANETGKDVDSTQALNLWIRSKGVVVVSTSAKEKNIQKLAETQGLPDLTKEEVEEVEAVGRKIYFRGVRRLLSSPFPFDLKTDGCCFLSCSTMSTSRAFRSLTFLKTSRRFTRST